MSLDPRADRLDGPGGIHPGNPRRRALITAGPQPDVGRVDGGGGDGDADLLRPGVADVDVADREHLGPARLRDLDGAHAWNSDNRQ